LRLDRPVGHPECGLIVRCPDCQDVQRAQRLNRLAAMAGLSDEQRRVTFAGLQPVRGVADAVRAASEFARNPAGWLVIWGAPGSGKTHLSLAVANALIAREQPVIWRYVPDLVYRMRELVSLQEPDMITPVLLDAPVLILDDLGAARWTDYVTERLELVFDRRYRDRVPTMVTLIGAERLGPGYDLAEDVKRMISVSIGRRMQDPAVCRIVRNAAPQWRGDAR
jgi:DNA replication protein DnaC